MFVQTWGTRGRTRPETGARMTLLFLFLSAMKLCPYSPRMSQVTPSDGSLFRYEVHLEWNLNLVGEQKLCQISF